MIDPGSIAGLHDRELQAQKQKPRRGAGVRVA
jgi:hypothetical protein